MLITAGRFFKPADLCTRLHIAPLTNSAQLGSACEALLPPVRLCLGPARQSGPAQLQGTLELFFVPRKLFAWAWELLK